MPGKRQSFTLPVEPISPPPEGKTPCLALPSGGGAGYRPRVRKAYFDAVYRHSRHEGCRINIGERSPVRKGPASLQIKRSEPCRARDTAYRTQPARHPPARRRPRPFWLAGRRLIPRHGPSASTSSIAPGAIPCRITRACRKRPPEGTPIQPPIPPPSRGRTDPSAS